MLSCTPGNGGFSALFLFRCEMTTEKNKKLRFSLQNWDLYVILKKIYTGKYVKTYKFCWILVISLTPFRLSLFCRNCILSEAGATRSTDSYLSSIYGPHSGQQLTMMPTMMTGRSFMNFKNSPRKQRPTEDLLISIASCHFFSLLSKPLIFRSLSLY